MMQLLYFFLLSFAQYFIGFGILTHLRLSLKRGIFMPLCLLAGVAVSSLLPFILQLLHIPITIISVFGSMAIVYILVNTRFRGSFKQLPVNWNIPRFSVKLYEIPALLVIAAIVLISIWRCFYLPPTPRDLTSGAEAIAEFAVREGSMINSVFSVDVSNNVYKPPFITSLQIMYKMAGFPFGQVWLSTIFVSFVVFLYQVLGTTIHKIFAGLLIIFMLAIPELYGYTFMALFDFPNAIYFCCALYFLFHFFETGKYSEFIFSAILMAMATYIRSETVVLIAMLVPLIIVRAWKNGVKVKTIFARCFLFLAPSVLLYIISVPVYINFYLPTTYPVGELVNTNFFNLSPFFKRLADITTVLFFGEDGIDYYAWFVFIFLGIFLIDLVVVRRMNRQSVNWFYGVMVIYLGLALLGYLLPLLDLYHSTKRGMLKIFPLMLLFLGNTELLKRLSQKMYSWEKERQ